MRHSLTILCLVSLVGTMSGQVTIDNSIELIAPDDAQRQVLGIPALVEPSAVQSAQQEQSNAHRTATAAVEAAVWVIGLSGLDTAPMPGTHLVVIAPEQSQPGEVLLQVNQHGPFVVVHRVGEPLVGEEVTPGAPLSLLFDGTRFHSLGGTVHRRRACPTGMVGVTEQFCTEIDERAPATFFEAARTCTEAGMRLCTWGEWFNACQLRVALGLQNMTDNWEFTDDTANEDNTVRFVGPSCTNAGTFLVSNGPQAYRCCLSK